MDKPVNKRIENRRANLRRLIQLHDGPKAFASLVGKPQSWISQIAGPNPTRPITEDTARTFERTLGLREGELDWPAPGSGAIAAPAVGRTIDYTTSARDAEIVQTLAAIWSSDQIDLPVLKFGQIAAYAITDAAETGVVPSHDRLRRLIELLK